MSSLKDKLKGIIGKPLDGEINSQKRNNYQKRSSKLLYTEINANNQSRGEILSQIKNKIYEFKHNRENYKNSLNDFEVSREALKKFYPSHNNEENDVKEKLNNSMNYNQINNDLNNKFTFGNLKLDENNNKNIANNNNFVYTQNNENEENDNFEIKKYINKSNSKPNISYSNNNNKYNYNKKDDFLNIDIKNIFKNKSPPNVNFEYKSINSLNYNEPKTTKAYKSSREYIKYNSSKNEPFSNFNYKNTNDNNFQNENNDNNKIKNQINFFMKQINSKDDNLVFSNNNKNNNKTIDNNFNRTEKRNKSLSFISNNTFKKQKIVPKISLLDINTLKHNILEMTNEDIENLPNEYITELKELSKAINSLFK